MHLGEIRCFSVFYLSDFHQCILLEICYEEKTCTQFALVKFRMITL